MGRSLPWCRPPTRTSANVDAVDIACSAISRPLVERMRILFAHSFYRVQDGDERHVSHQVDLVSSAQDVELFSEGNVELSKSLATATRMLYSRGKKREVGAIIDRFAPDIVHVYPFLGQPSLWRE
jgi:hypothetical protein